MNWTVIEKQQSLLKTNELPNILYIAFGLTGLLSNTLIILTLGYGPPEVRFKPLTIIVLDRTFKMRTKSMKFWFSLAISDIFVCVSYLNTSIFELYWLGSDDLYIETSIMCWFRDRIWKFVAVNANRMMNFNIAVDRLFAIVVPLKYRLWGNAYTYTMICLPWTIAAVFGLLRCSLKTPSLTILNCGPGAVKTTIDISFGKIALAQVGITLAIYMVIWMYVFYKMKSARKTGNSSVKELKDLIEYKAVKTLSVVIVVHFFCYVVSTALLNYAVSSAGKQLLGKHKLQFINSTFTLWVFNSACNYVIYMATNSGFRAAFLRLFCGKGKASAKVTTTAMVPMTMHVGKQDRNNM